MKLGVISDTHDHLGRVSNALQSFNDKGVEHILHAGDICSPFVFSEFKKFYMPLTAVFGNNDGDWLLLTKTVHGAGEIKKGPLSLELSGRKIALMHEPVFIDALADSGHFDLVVYGHLHGREERKRGKALILNPGECSGYLTNDPSVMVCDLSDMSVEAVKLD